MSSKKEQMKSREIESITQLEQVKLSTMWAGSKEITEYSMFILDDELNKFKLTKINYSQSWYKLVDEIICNAMDHFYEFQKLVSYIEINFDKKTGIVTVKNNGPSIGIYKKKNCNGVEMYVAQMAASDFNTSSNYKTPKKYGSGQNGAGLKICSAYSHFLELETVDVKKHKKYWQRFDNRLEIINEPIITDEKSKEDYTSIKFLPCYEVFGYKNGYKDVIKNNNCDDLYKLIETRAYQAKVFTGIKVILNDKEIILSNTFIDFAKMHLIKEEDAISEPEILFTKLISKDGEPPLELCIGIADGEFQHVSIINGVNVYDGGNYITYIQDQIADALRSNVEKLIKGSKVKYNKKMVTSCLFIFVKWRFANPAFDSQIKNKMMNPLKDFGQFEFKQSDFKKIWNLLCPYIEEKYLQKTQAKEKKRTIRGEVNVPKCYDAQFAGKEPHKCILWIAEGDSAMGTVKSGLTHNCSELSFKYCGIFNTGGVIINCRTKCKEKQSSKLGTIIIKNAQLENNERLISLVKVLGLDYNKKYDNNTTEGKKEIDTLRYSRVIVAVDQDVDGHGIYGLILNFFEYFWPNLVKIGFISKFNTPIIRAFPLKGGKPDTKNKVLEFYSMPQFKTWIDDEFDGNESKVMNRYEINYYKGLGSHEDSDIPRMFAEYKNQILTADLDNDAHNNLNIFYGKDTDARKNVLKTPSEEPNFKINPVPVSYILNTTVKEFHRDKIARSLPNAIDGLTESRRKVLWTARYKFGTSESTNKKMKVAMLASETTKYTAYMHGEQCISDTIILMAQNYPGSNHLPMLIPRGYFGGRSKGGKDSASPRYIYTQLNQELCYAMYPYEDDYLLDFVFDEGQRCEPKYLIPILPMVILENLSGNIGVGWSSQIWARDINSVIKNVKAMIKGEQKTCKVMKTWLKDNKGRIVFNNGKEYSIGKYEYDEKKNTIHVTELPLGMYPHSYLEWDKEKPKTKKDSDIADNNSDKTPEERKKKIPLWANEYFIQKPLCETNKDINITFYLKKGAIDLIKNKYQLLTKSNEAFIDPIESFLGLKNSLNSNLNAINYDGSVIEFKKYNEMVDNWFSIRKNLYEKRINREIILLKLMILYLKNIIRYMDNESTYNFTTKTELDTMKETLEKEKYDKINEVLLKSPKYTPIDELEKQILYSNAASYTYLLSLNSIDKSANNSRKRKELLKEKEKRLNEIEKQCKMDTFPGASIWLNEINKLENILENGFATNWNANLWEYEYKTKKNNDNQKKKK